MGPWGHVSSLLIQIPGISCAECLVAARKRAITVSLHMTPTACISKYLGLKLGRMHVQAALTVLAPVYQAVAMLKAFLQKFPLTWAVMQVWP